MYLSDLEIFGFKSFGKKTKLKFTDGLTCVVGPNGCGKTNIVDGIRWVLGEQRSSVIRSEVMENVIFNGNAKRKPLGMAEVVMTIQNNRNILPTEYSEVQITRRLFRDGDSNYLINGQRCRLKDIHELFMDTGMGANSYSVIELKMVEAILSGKPEERRQLLEEAAGVVRYKTRRKEATRKLGNVQQDLERLTDIESEVSKQVNSLQRQASKTRRYNEYITELKTIELQVMARDYIVLKSKAVEVHRELDGLRKELNKSEFVLTDKEKSLAMIKANLQASQMKLAESRGKKENLLAQIAESEKRLAIAIEKSTYIENSTERIKSEMENSGNIRINAEKSLEAAKARLGRYSDDIEKMEEEKRFAQDNEKSARQELEEARLKANSVATSLGKLQSDVQNTKSIINRLESRLTEVLDRSVTAGSQIQAFDTSSMELDSKIKIGTKRVEELNGQLMSQREELEEVGRKKDSVKAEIEQLNEKISGVRSELNSANNMFRFYESLVDTDSVSSHLRESGWTKGTKQQLAELIGVDEKYRNAIGSLFSEISHYFVVDSFDEADSGIESLRKSKKGKATFLVRNSEGGSGHESSLPLIEGLIKVTDIIRMPESISSFIHMHYSNAYIVQDQEEAKRIVAEHQGIKVVTMQGRIYSSLGQVRGGSDVESESMMIGKQEKIDELQNLIVELKAELERLGKELVILVEERDNIDLDRLRKELGDTERAIRNGDNELSQLKIKKDGLGSRIEVLKESIEKNEIEKESTQNEINDLSASLKEADLRIGKYQDDLENAKAETDIKAKRLEECSSLLRNHELEYVRLRGEVGQAEKDQKRLERSLNDIAFRIRTGKDEMQELASQAVEYSKEIEYSRTDIEELQLALSSAENLLSQAGEEEKEFEDTFQLEEQELRGARKAVEKVKESLHKQEIEQSEIGLRKTTLEEKARESHDTDIEDVIPGEETENLEESRNRVTELKQKLQSIGSVNFMALEEYEETKERHTFMVAQIADLTESEKTLQKTIKEINETAQMKFLETFGKIRDNFRVLFNSLFDGEAEADLELKGENPLEADIHITAKPPGKKPHSIEMLSGGEKTLTAISLLFAIYMVKPSPFCILDEVDAPLDDANIGRFVSLLRRFSDQTQFLIVTHNKKTMEAADNLYGVTQQESGLSEVVSVKIDGKRSNAA